MIIINTLLFVKPKTYGRSIGDVRVFGDRHNCHCKIIFIYDILLNKIHECNDRFH